MRAARERGAAHGRARRASRHGARRSRGRHHRGLRGLELYGDAALLRSLAVTPSWQGRGLGRQLARSALELGREAGVKTFCLLTLTAREFFARELAFRPVARSESAKAAESCPRLYPFAREVLQWPFDDPSRVQGTEEIRLAAFRRTREEIDARIRDWLTDGG